MSILFALNDVPDPNASDLGKLMLGLGMVFLIVKAVVDVLFKFLPPRQPAAEVATKASVEALALAQAQFETKANAQLASERIDRQLTQMTADYKELAKYVNARYEDLNHQNNEIRISLETFRRETVELVHQAISEIGKKIDDKLEVFRVPGSK